MVERGDGLDGQDNAKPVCPRDRMRENLTCVSETWAEDKAPDELLAADVNKGVGVILDGRQGSREG